MDGIPEAVPPMLAVEGELPTGDWAYEFKWDGYRCGLRIAADGATRLTSRNGLDLTGRYPELAGAPGVARAGRDAVLDGEVVALGAAGQPDFGLLQQRNRGRPGPRLLAGTPVTYFAFDVLRLDGAPLLREPYTRRRELLAELGTDHAGASAAGRVVIPPHYAGPGPGPDQLLDIARQHGLEGLVAKRLDSPYLPGRRSRLWIKKPLVRTREAVVGGWQPGEGAREGAIGSLLLGAYDERGRLVYIGQVGSGFGAAALADLLARLGPLVRDSSPFAGPLPAGRVRRAHWVEPRLVGEVAHRAWTRDGRLRQPSWRGLRPDREPGEVLLPRDPG